jgi:hypothetical protein
MSNATCANTINPETLTQFQRADEIINEATLIYNTQKQQEASILSEIRLDAAQKFQQDSTSIINQVAKNYKEYISRTGEHPTDIKVCGATKLSVYHNPIAEPPSGKKFNFWISDTMDIYKEESQKACEHTGQILKMLGYKVIKAHTQKNTSEDINRNLHFTHDCQFWFNTNTK